jgi:hypothetical protein
MDSLHKAQLDHIYPGLGLTGTVTWYHWLYSWLPLQLPLHSSHERRLTNNNTCLCWNLCKSGAAPRIPAHIRAISSTSNLCAESSCCTVIGANSKFKGGPPRLLKAQAALPTTRQCSKRAKPIAAGPCASATDGPE